VSISEGAGLLYFQAIPNLDGSEIDGIHLLWAPPYPTGHSVTGFAIDRRDAQQDDRVECLSLADALLDQARRRGFVHTPEATVWAAPHDAGPWTYRVDLRATHRWVTVQGRGGIAAFAGRRDGQVADGQWFVGDACRLAGNRIDSVWIVAKSVGVDFDICGDVIVEESWLVADRIVDGLQVPFQAVNPLTGNEAEEHALASDQALPGTIDGDWDEVSLYANTALDRPFREPAWRTTTARPGGDGDEWDLAPFGLVAAATIVPEWNRALGFAHLDRDGLVEDAIYDYRLIGTVPRVDRDEHPVGFYTVPRGYRLPHHFWLGDVGVWSPVQLTVRAETEPGTPVESVRKGIHFQEWVHLVLPSSTDRIVVAGSSDSPVEFVGFDGGVGVASVPALLEERTEVDFGTPVNSVRIESAGFLASVVADPIPAGLDPFELVEVSDVVLGVRFATTPPPNAPLDVSVVNLGDALRTSRTGTPDFNRGFEVSWEPPPKIDPLLAEWWPTDATTAPPTEVARYTLERAWPGVSFHPRPDTDGFQVPSRNAEPVSDDPEPGFDLLRAFPLPNTTGVADDDLVRAIDVLPDDDPDYGEMVTYRVRSIDAIGRPSTPTQSAPTQLQKLVRPPPPTTPASVTPPAPGAPTPVGVQVRLLQVDDPDLSAADVALAAGQDVVVVEWGWGPEERELDPLVTEFRIYEHDGAPLDVNVEILGPPTARPGGWALPCRFDTTVGANQFARHRAQINRPFVIASHGAGPTTELRLDSVNASPSTPPSGSSFALTRTDGAELDPATWHRRVRTVDRAAPVAADDVEDYRAVIPASWIAVSAGRPIQRTSIGVSAADSEPYVPDRRAATESEPRPGNESTVSAREVVARHRGRPDLAVADLGPVNSLSTGRRGGNEVHRTFVPTDYLPAGAATAAPMRLERLPASAILPRLHVDDSAIQLEAIGGSLAAWVLSPGDAAELRAAYDAGPVPDKFLVHAAARLDGLERLATTVADVDPATEVLEVLPNNPGRWVYRLRALDGAGKVSLSGQVMQMALTVPTPMRASSPELVDLDLSGDQATVTVRHRSGAESELLVFHSVDDRLMPARASLATVRNRPDLDAIDVVVVRDDRGRRLAGQRISPGADQLASASFTVPDNHRFHAWAVAVSDEGLPSRLIGPLHVTRGLPPEVA
jgi:hypothetical protein